MDRIFFKEPLSISIQITFVFILLYFSAEIKAAEPPLYTGAGSGTHYWIDGATGSNSNPGTEALPWQTIDKIESITLQPGDLVHVQEGTYIENGSLYFSNITGTAAAWIGIIAEGDVFVTHTSYSNNLLNISGCNYLFIKGFEMKPSGGYLDIINLRTAASNYLSLDSCYLHDGEHGIACATFPDDTELSHLTVYNCRIEDMTRSGIYWGYYEAVDKKYVIHSRIANSLFLNCPSLSYPTGYGIQIKGGGYGNVIEDNVFISCGGTSRAAIATYHISREGVTNTVPNVIKGNFLYSSRHEGIWVSEGAVIENNVIVDSGFIDINVIPRNTGGYGTFFGNVKVNNNTIYRGFNSIEIGSGTCSPPMQISNNVVIGTSASSRVITINLSSGISGSANFIYGTSSGASSLGVTSMADTSCFASTNYGDQDFLYPSAGSPLIGSADAATASATDFYRTPRDTQPDAGALEYLTASNNRWILTDDFKVFESDNSPPGEAASLTALPGDTQIDLTWTNPGDSDFSGVMIRRQTGTIPVNLTDGTEVFNGISTAFSDNGLINGTTYYYTVFTYDTSSNYSAGISTSAVPESTAFDTDGDGIADDWELAFFGNLTTASANSDYPDGDNAIDLLEYLLGYNPTDPGSSAFDPTLNDFSDSTDTDSDGLSDMWEYEWLGHFNSSGTDDPDGDSLSNAQEQTFGTDPDSNDSDNDGMDDAWEINNTLNPLINDAENDNDNDTFTNLIEYASGTDPNDSSSVPGTTQTEAASQGCLPGHHNILFAFLGTAMAILCITRKTTHSFFFLWSRT